MDLMDAVERQALAGKAPVEGRKPEGKEPAGSGRGMWGRHQPAQIFKARGRLEAPRSGRGKTGRWGKKHENIYRTKKERRQYEMTPGHSSP